MPNVPRPITTFLTVSLIAACLWPVSIPAAETDLAKRIPGPSVLYVGWAGADACKPAFEQTALGRMLAEPEFAKLCEVLRPQVEALLKKHLAGEGGADVQKPIQELLRMVWRRPGAINVMRIVLMKTGVDLQAAAVWHLGAEVEQFEALLKRLQDALFAVPEGQPPATRPVAIGEFSLSQCSLGGGLPELTWGRVGEYYILTVGKATPKMVVDSLTGQSEKPPLSENADFAAARKGLKIETGRPALEWQISIKEILRRLPLVFTVIELQQAKAGRKKSDRLPLGILVSRAIRALELRTFNSLAGAVSMHEDGYRIAWYLHAPGATSGLMTFFRQKPVTDADLAVVPREASCFYATNLDLNGFYGEMTAAFKQVDPNMYDGCMEKLADLEQDVGAKLVDDVLAPLDDGWIIYTAPSSEGLLGTGFAIIAEAKDAGRVERGVTKLAQYIISRCGGQGVKLETHTTPDGRTVHVVEAECVKPWQGFAVAWGAVGRYLVIGLDKQMAMSAMTRLGGGAKTLAASSILKRADFSSRRRLLPERANAVGYLDAKEILGGLYRAILPSAPQAAARLADAGIKLDASLLPKPETVERHLFGMVTGLTTDDEGVLMVSHAPLPLPTPTVRSAAAVLVSGAVVHLSSGTPTSQPATAPAPEGQ